MNTNSKKKILIFIDWFLPGTKSGGPVRSYSNLIEWLKDDYEFLVVTRDTDYCETDPYQEIESNAWNKLSNHLSVYYISNYNLSTKTINELIDQTDFDIAYVNGIYSWFFSILPVFFLKKMNKKVIISARGMLNPQAFSVKGRKKKVFLFFARMAGLYKNVVFHATNEDEKEQIVEEVVADKVMVAPNLPRKVSSSNHQRNKRSGVVKMVSVSRVSREKGTHHILKALSQIETLGDKKIQLDLFGPIYDQDYWEHCKKIIQKLPKQITVKHQGTLESDEVPETLKNYEFFAMLSEGENFGHAILEAFSSGCPVIISNMTPWKNLKSKKVGFDLSLTDGVKIREAIIFVLEMDQQEYQNWSNSAFCFAKEFINDQSVLQSNKELFKI
ncbi:glycosyltransferase [Mangrovimonas sp. CR14]|uniref:glycosyltransferase family 4 protein n=1 Tax=Mangrovimonas sp. CR14 TaxID=2706120 RepID=UPI001420D375|nr:glycosyltransferase [Mangrovimonas sp. CR14]NIK91353.1 glycosyltransferase [Mangrovimonas sp. CR14]